MYYFIIPIDIIFALIIGFLLNIVFNRTESKENESPTIKSTLKNYILFINILVGIYVENSITNPLENGVMIPQDVCRIIILGLCIFIVLISTFKSAIQVFYTWCKSKIKASAKKLLKEEIKNIIKNAISGCNPRAAFFDALNSISITVLGLYVFKSLLDWDLLITVIIISIVIIIIIIIFFFTKRKHTKTTQQTSDKPQHSSQSKEELTK